jgi:RHS repeat-associated protein
VTSPAAGATATGSEVSFTYPTAAGDPLLNYRPDTATDAQGNISSIQYDPNTKSPSQINTPGGLGGTSRRYYEGDAAGTTCGAKPGSLCRSTDGNGNDTTYTYNAAGNPVTITRPAPLGAITNTFDAAGRLATSKDGNNQTATYTYDKNDRLTQTRYGATCVAATCVTYTYDAAGNLTTRVDAAGTTTYTWDAQNRPTGKTIGGTTTTVTYDGASNILTSKDPSGTTTYRYDAANRLLALAAPGGSCPATPVAPNSTGCTSFDYDNNNRRTKTTYPNGVENRTAYDNAGRITSITAVRATGTVVTKRSYTYTTNGTKDGSLRASMTTVDNTLTTYQYDKMNRLTSATTGAVTETWTYDNNGNRLTAAKTGAATTYSTYNAADQLCWTHTTNGTCGTKPTGATGYSYDANGNTTTAATTTNVFNVFNQLTSNTTGSTTTTFAYAGERNTERTAAGPTSFLNGTLGITQQTTAGATTTFLRDPDGTLISMTNADGTFYYTTDALGSVIRLTDDTATTAATYAYDSWGNTTTATSAQANKNPWQYAGGYKDTATALTKFGARYYDPFTGRFTQPDPSGQESNRYAYAGANPINNADPSGLVCLSWNHDSPDCGWYGSPAYDIPLSCQLGATSLSLGLIFPPGAPYTALRIIFATFSGGITTLGCSGNPWG